MINDFLLLADIVKYIHYICILYVLTGYLYTPANYIKYYLLFIIVIFLDWNDFDGQCTLTSIEHYFRYGTWDNRQAEEENAPEFFRPTLNKIFGINLNRAQASRVNYFLFMTSFLFGFIKLLLYYNI